MIDPAAVRSGRVRGRYFREQVERERRRRYGVSDPEYANILARLLTVCRHRWVQRDPVALMERSTAEEEMVMGKLMRLFAFKRLFDMVRGRRGGGHHGRPPGRRPRL